MEAQEASARNLAGAPTPEAAELPRVGQAEAKEEEKQKSFGEMLKKLAEKVGVPLLHLIQAGAYGYGGINKPTVLERLKEQQAERKKTEVGRAWDAKIRQIDRDFAERMGEIQRQYQWEVMNAQNEQEKAMAEYNAQRQMEVARFQAEEAYKRAELAAQNQAAGKAPSKADFGKALGIK